LGFTVEIKRTADGRVARWHSDQEWEEIDLYRWTDGNYGCDCNREIYFMEAIGAKVDDQADLVCGETRFQVLRITSDDGSRLL